MAHSKDSEISYQIHECPICKQRLKNPRMLKCLHSFCGRCLGRHMNANQQDGSARCPICDFHFLVPQDGVASIKHNTFLEMISNIYPDDSSDVKCEICKLQGIEIYGSSVCVDCREYLCLECAKSHRFTSSSFNHKVISLEDVSRHIDAICRIRKVYCPDHPEEEIEVACEDCNRPQCPLCPKANHEQHTKSTIEKAAAKAAVVMRILLEPLKLITEDSEKLSDERKKVLDSLDEQEDQLDSDMQQKFTDFENKIRKEIYDKARQARKSLQEKVNIAREKAKTAYEEAKHTETAYKVSLRYIQNLLDSAQDMEKVLQFQDIKSRLEELSNQVGDGEVITPVFKFHPENLEMPSLSMDVMAKFEKLQSFSSYVKQSRVPVMRETASQTRCFETLIEGEKEPSHCCGLAIYGKWFITTSKTKVKAFCRSTGDFDFQVSQSEHSLAFPTGVKCNEKGEIFVTDDSIHGVLKYNAKGQLQKKSKEDIYSEDWSFMACRDDMLVVTDPEGSRVLILDFECNVTKVIGKEELKMRVFKPRYISIDNEGHLVVGDHFENRVHKIDCEEPTTTNTSDKLGGRPYGICIDEWGNILVAVRDKAHANIIVIMSGQLECARVIVSDNVNRPTGLGICGPGEVAVLEEKTGNVKEFKYADFGLH